MATLREMNPFVQVSALAGSPAMALAPEALRQCDVLLLCGQPASVIAQADVLCREAGVKLFAGVCRGIFGWAFADLGQHRYVVEVRTGGGQRGRCIQAGQGGCDASQSRPALLLPACLLRHPRPRCAAGPPQNKEEQADGSVSKQMEERSDSFASWADATSCSLSGVSVKRLAKLYLLIRGELAWGSQGV